MKIAVVGTGTMGAGIIQTFAQSGIDVVVKGRSEASLERAISSIAKNLKRSVEKGRITEDMKNETLERIACTLEMEPLKDVDIVIEAAAENMEIKKALFAELDALCKPSTILATNTSSLSITDIASATNRPDKVIGMHFFNPVPIMALIEIIRGYTTSDETVDLIKDTCEEIGKTPVEVDEAPGFVVNRILIPMINEAVAIYSEGVASAEDIDTAMKLGVNHPIGPLALSDLIGTDVVVNILEVLYEDLGDQKYRPHPLLKKMLNAGLLGRKSKQGFYSYA